MFLGLYIYIYIHICIELIVTFTCIIYCFVGLFYYVLQLALNWDRGHRRRTQTRRAPPPRPLGLGQLVRVTPSCRAPPRTRQWQCHRSYAYSCRPPHLASSPRARPWKGPWRRSQPHLAPPQRTPSWLPESLTNNHLFRVLKNMMNLTIFAEKLILFQGCTFWNLTLPTGNEERKIKSGYGLSSFSLFF